MNRAMPFFIQNETKDLPPFTESIAMKYGWIWKIPVNGRYGCGYVFDSSMTTDEEARQEQEYAKQQSIMKGLNLKHKFLDLLKKESNREKEFEKQQQKIKELNPVPFSKAVNFESNYKYIKYAAVPLLVLIGVLVVSPQIVTESSKRIIEHDTFFEKKAPFDFIVSSKKLEAFQNNVSCSMIQIGRAHV